MTTRTRRKAMPTIRDLLGEDADVIALEGFRPLMHRAIEKGERFRLSDGIVRQFPMYFAVIVPVDRVFGEIER